MMSQFGLPKPLNNAAKWSVCIRLKGQALKNQRVFINLVWRAVYLVNFHVYYLAMVCIKF